MSTSTTQTKNVINLELSNEEKAVCLSLVLSAVRQPKLKLGSRVKLVEDKHFAKDMKFLEDLGYVRNAQENCFDLTVEPMACPFDELPENVVSIADNDPLFLQKMKFLEQNGFERDSTKNCWTKSQDISRKELFNKIKKIPKKSVSVASLVIVGALSIALDSL